MCLSCGVGTYSLPGASACTPCAAGTYGLSAGLSVCLSCSIGTASDVTGATSATVCTLCVAGKYAGSPRAVACVSCPANTHSSRDYSACLANAGFYIGSAGTRFPPSPYMSGPTLTVGAETFTILSSSNYPTEQTWKAFSNIPSTSNVDQWSTSVNSYSGGGNGAYAGAFNTLVDGNLILGEWLQLQSTTQRTLGLFSITASNLNPQRSVKSFVLAGSNDGSVWSSLQAVSDLTMWTANLERSFTVPVAQAFTYFRLIVTNITATSAEYVSIDEFKLFDAQVAACTGSCAIGTTKFCSPDGATVYCCTPSQYFISGISTACVTCPANSAPDSAYQERCLANTGYFGPTLYMFDGSTPSYRNFGSKVSHTVSPVGWRPTFSSVASRTGAYFDSSVNGNYYVVSNDYNTITLAFWIYVNAAYVSGVLSEVMGMYSGNTIGVQCVLGPDNAGPGLYVVYGTNGGSVFTTAAQFPVNQWLHAVLVIPSGTDRLQRVFVNGVKAGTRSNNLVSTQDLLNFQTLVVGASQPFHNRKYKGYLQQLTMYNYAMTDAEAIALYNSGTPRVFMACPGSCSTGTVKHCTMLGVSVCCPPGTFFRGETDSACQPCPAGTFAGISQSNACISCPANSNSGSSASICTANSGYYNLDTSLKAYYTFNPDALLTDVTGITGLLTASASSPTSQLTGPFGASSYSAFLTQSSSAFTTAANNQYFTLPSFTLPDGMSICTWFWVSPSITRPWNRVWDVGRGPADESLYLTVYGATTDLVFGAFQGTTRTIADLGFGWTGGSGTGVWKHTCLTISGTAGNFWLDGSPKAFTLSGARNAAAILTSNYIGRSNWVADYYWYGAIDEFRIYTKALSSIEVAALHSFRGDTYSPMIILQCIPCASGQNGVCSSLGAYPAPTE